MQRIFISAGHLDYLVT